MPEDAPAQTSLRDAIAAVSVPVVGDEDLRDLEDAAEEAALDLTNARRVAARVNDPDALPAVALEGIVAAEGLEAAAQAVERRFSAVRKAAKAEADRLRAALAADMQANARKRVESSAHAASLDGGAFAVVVEDPDALPLGMLRTTVKPDLSAIGKALSANEDVPGARRERGPAGVRIVKLKETVGA